LLKQRDFQVNFEAQNALKLTYTSTFNFKIFFPEVIPQTAVKRGGEERGNGCLLLNGGLHGYAPDGYRMKSFLTVTYAYPGVSKYISTLVVTLRFCDSRFASFTSV